MTPPQFPETPETDDFRRWLSAALTATGIKPARASLAIGASVNLVGAFLRDPARDITLSRAAALERHLRAVARITGVELPAIRPAAEGGAQ